MRGFERTNAPLERPGHGALRWAFGECTWFGSGGRNRGGRPGSRGPGQVLDSRKVRLGAPCSEQPYLGEDVTVELNADRSRDEFVFSFMPSLLYKYRGSSCRFRGTRCILCVHERSEAEEIVIGLNAFAPTWAAC